MGRSGRVRGIECGVLSQLGSQFLARAEEENFDMGARLVQDASNGRNIKALGVFEPQGLKLHIGQALSSQVPESVAVLALSKKLGGIGWVEQLRERFSGGRRRGAVEIDALAVGDGKKPGREGLARVVVADGPERPYKVSCATSWASAPRWARLANAKMRFS